jgi:hypothetical protein
MALSKEKTKILLSIVDRAMHQFLTERDHLHSIVSTSDDVQAVNVMINKKTLSCLEFRELAEVREVDEEFIDFMSTDNFNFILKLIGDDIENLNNQSNALVACDNLTATSATQSIAQHVTVLEDIKKELLSMFSYF